MNKPNTNKSKSKHYPKDKKGNNKEFVKANSVAKQPHCKVSQPINNPAYYFTNPVMKEQLTDVTFNEFTGVPNLVGSLVDGTLYNESIPYAMRITLNPSAGFTAPDGDATMGNALNLASLALYTDLTANNAKTSNYAPQDITMLLLAFGSVISLTSYITRTFGLAYTYNQRNRAYPKAIVEASGVDYDDLVANFANYRTRFNTLMVAASKLPIPRNITYFDKCAELYSGIYLDMAGSDMAQSYVFAPDSVWLLDETGSEEGTILRPFVILNNVDSITTMNLLLSNLNLMISALLESSTLNYIYSDILRLATKEGMPLYVFSVVPNDYTVLPQYVPEVRMWINNLTIMGRPVASPQDGYTRGNTVFPDADTNKVTYRPQFGTPLTRAAALRDPYLNFDSSVPSADEIISSTRLTSVAKYEETDSGYVSTSVALPDHYVTALVVFSPNKAAQVLGGNYILSLDQMSALANFDWSPVLRVIKSDGSDFIGICSDLHYYTTVDFGYLSRLHDASYLGLFEIR